MKTSLALLCLCLSAGALRLGAADAPVPARAEPKHHVVLENDYVRVLDVHIPAGEGTLFHVHEIPSVVVYVTNSRNETQPHGATTWSPRTIKAGVSHYAAYDEKPITHRVRNPGPGLFRVYDIELLHAPLTAEAFALPEWAALKPNWSQKAVRSLTLRLPPGAHRTLAPGPCAYLFIQIAGEATFSTSDGAPRELRAQEFLFQPARTGFIVSNGGSAPFETIVLELR